MQLNASLHCVQEKTNSLDIVQQKCQMWTNLNKILYAQLQ